MATSQDIRQLVTDKIISLLEKGGNVYREEWLKSAQGGFPFNAKTNVKYNGVNVLLLWNAALESNYKSNAWLTYKQAADMGAQVRKGEKGTMCVYFEMVKKKGAAEDADEAGFYPMCKSFYVFNADQIDGLELVKADAIATPEFSPNEQAEQILAASKAFIKHGGESAFYSPSHDAITLPAKTRFFNESSYYATALHELTHWTGHETRLNRNFGKRFGSESYAFEELVAELGAAFVVGAIGFIDATIENHAAYLESWLKVLKNDKMAIFTACKQASLAYDFIIGQTGLNA